MCQQGIYATLFCAGFGHALTITALFFILIIFFSGEITIDVLSRDAMLDRVLLKGANDIDDLILFDETLKEEITRLDKFGSAPGYYYFSESLRYNTLWILALVFTCIVAIVYIVAVIAVKTRDANLPLMTCKVMFVLSDVLLAPFAICAGYSAAAYLTSDFSDGEIDFLLRTYAALIGINWTSPENYNLPVVCLIVIFITFLPGAYSDYLMWYKVFPAIKELDQERVREKHAVGADDQDNDSDEDDYV